VLHWRLAGLYSFPAWWENHPHKGETFINFPAWKEPRQESRGSLCIVAL